jgi:hypothetical protein
MILVIDATHLFGPIPFPNQLFWQQYWLAQARPAGNTDYRFYTYKPLRKTVVNRPVFMQLPPSPSISLTSRANRIANAVLKTAEQQEVTWITADVTALSKKYHRQILYQTPVKPEVGINEKFVNLATWRDPREEASTQIAHAKVFESVVLPGFHPLPWAARQSAHTQFAGGSEYFVVPAPLDASTLLPVLKAFSGFKKWQQSSMFLVLTGPSLSTTDSLLESIAHYKYRQSVAVIADPDDDSLRSIVGGAYAAVFPASDQHPEHLALSSIAAETPAIVANLALNTQLFGGSVLTYDPESADGLSKAMVNIFRDEALRNNLVRSGSALAMSRPFTAAFES